jgi:bifunctional DNA-binding transcriptional regulator/antitoxin component of YhaV-PrlF toxin-antitoxin module
MGIKVKADKRWRITIPAQLREGFKEGQEFTVMRKGKNLLLLEAVIEREEIVKRIKSIMLKGDPKRRKADAAPIKDRLGAVKV